MAPGLNHYHKLVFKKIPDTYVKVTEQGITLTFEKIYQNINYLDKLIHDYKHKSVC